MFSTENFLLSNYFLFWIGNWCAMKNGLANGRKNLFQFVETGIKFTSTWVQRKIRRNRALCFVKQETKIKKTIAGNWSKNIYVGKHEGLLFLLMKLFFESILSTMPQTIRTNEILNQQFWNICKHCLFIFIWEHNCK